MNGFERVRPRFTKRSDKIAMSQNWTSFHASSFSWSGLTCHPLLLVLSLIPPHLYPVISCNYIHLPQCFFAIVFNSFTPFYIPLVVASISISLLIGTHLPIFLCLPFLLFCIFLCSSSYLFISSILFPFSSFYSSYPPPLLLFLISASSYLFLLTTRLPFLSYLPPPPLHIRLQLASWRRAFHPRASSWLGRRVLHMWTQLVQGLRFGG